MRSFGTFLVLLAVATIASAGQFACPSGTKPNGERTPDGSEAWCEKVDADGKVMMHGPYRAWWPNGKLGNTGQYSNGVPVGTWTAWDEKGNLQGTERYSLTGEILKGSNAH